MRINWASVTCLRAIEVAVGGRKALADTLGVAASTVNNWHEKKKIPGAHVLALYELSGGKFTVQELLGVNDENIDSV